MVEGELTLDVVDPPTVTTVLNALESRYPMLRGTIRDHGSDRIGDARSSVSSLADATSHTTRRTRGSPTA